MSFTKVGSHNLDRYTCPFANILSLFLQYRCSGEFCFVTAFCVIWQKHGWAVNIKFHFDAQIKQLRTMQCYKKQNKAAISTIHTALICSSVDHSQSLKKPTHYLFVKRNNNSIVLQKEKNYCPTFIFLRTFIFYADINSVQESCLVKTCFIKKEYLLISGLLKGTIP